MPDRRIVLAAALAGLTLCPLRADALDGHTLITRCAATAGGLRGLAAIRRACPNIDWAVASLKVGPLLPAHWDRKVSPAALADLDALAARYAGPPPSLQPAASDLRALALRMQPDSAPSGSSLWSRFKAWLSRLFAPAAPYFKWLRPPPGWTVGPSTRGMLLLLTSALLLLAGVVFVVAELRAAGHIGAGRHRLPYPRRRDPRPPGFAAAGVDEGVDPSQAFASPASALRTLLEALRRSRRIERDGYLTCREVLTRAVFDTSGQRDGFAQIAVLAERELFGPDGTRVAVPDELRPGLQTLYTQLSAVPATRTAS